MSRATVVVVGNDYLGNRARRAGAGRLEHLPTVVDLDRYPPAPASAMPPSQRPFTIGWIGSPATAGYVRLIQPALAEVCRHGRARVVLVGSGPLRLEGVPVEVLPWTEDDEAATVQGFDVGIMPLPDEPWERGKCGYKLIQYMACARPVVASPVGVNRGIVAHNTSGLLAGGMADWVAALNRLRDDAALREAMGQAGRDRVEREYCLQVTGHRLAEVLRGAVESSPPRRCPDR